MAIRRGCLLYFNIDFYEEARCGWAYIKGGGIVLLYANTFKILLFVKLFPYPFFFLSKGEKIQFSILKPVHQNTEVTC